MVVVENSRLFEIPDRNPVDAVLRRAALLTPQAPAPPAGSGLRQIPSDRGLPYLGPALKWLRWGPASQLDTYRRLGPVSYSRPLGQPTITVAGPEATAIVMSNKERAFGQGWDYYGGPFFHRGLLMLQFDEHMFHRRLMQQAFTRSRLEAYFANLAGLVRGVVAQWPVDRPLPLYPTVKDLTLEVAGEIFMDTEVGAERDRLNDAFVDCLHAGLSIVRHPVPFGKWRKGLRGRQVLEEYFYRMIPAKRKSVEADFFSALCHAQTETGEQFDDADIVNHMIFLIMAAHDTTTIATTAAAYFLGKHPEWQDRARAESLARDADSVDLHGLEQLHTLDLVIKESLRLVPPVPGFVRRTVRDTELLGYHLPADTLVLVAQWGNHLLPELWSEPERFDPERFAEHRREDKSHRCAWLPFGAGAHKCIGMHFGVHEAKTVLDAMLRNFEWRLPDDYEIPWGYSSLPFPRDNAPLVLRRRQPPITAQ